MTKKRDSRTPATYDGEIATALTDKLDASAIRARKLGIALLGLSQDELVTGLAVTGALLDIALLSSKLMSERASTEENLSSVAYDLLRQIDKFGQRGKKVIEGAAKGHAATHGTTAQKDERSKLYQAAANDVIKLNAALSWSAVCQSVGRRFDVSSKTISRHAVDPRN